ncbi:STAS domain-containing protein [Planctomicrobium sp. SH668]|uniref:STAS domain-containing protein n=1 Tax=Planctomicrobium sp. SH668 TaxID=3448126 RepID=UPI003F5B447E
MADRKYTHDLEVSPTEHGALLSIGDMEIWDGADLSLIRDTLFRLIANENVKAAAIDMHAVQHIPSGFFGMLFDWMERGIEIRLVNPRERVQQMLWFRKFFELESTGVYQLRDSNRIDETNSENLWEPTSAHVQNSSTPPAKSALSIVS